MSFWGYLILIFSLACNSVFFLRSDSLSCAYLALGMEQLKVRFFAYRPKRSTNDHSRQQQLMTQVEQGRFSFSFYSSVLKSKIDELILQLVDSNSLSVLSHILILYLVQWVDTMVDFIPAR